MPNTKSYTEPTRPLPTAQPDCDGNFRATTFLSPTDCKARALLPIPSSKVIPVIVIPGIMGSNLCATTDRSKSPNLEVKPGAAAWRPPNGKAEALGAAYTWSNRKPAERQRILDPATLDVDSGGPVLAPPDKKVAFAAEVARDRGWGEIYSESYSPLLCALELRLNEVFEHLHDETQLRPSWAALAAYDRRLWAINGSSSATARLTEAELQKVAKYHFPVYAVGYNWLQSNKLSAARLEQRVQEIIKFWTERKQECSQVILVTHSMGGLVARACAKKISTRILGIVHGVMPALGAPVCYRRIATGTESSSLSNKKHGIGDFEASRFADIAGSSQADTTAVMATAAGPLELLPNNEYPKPWLHITFNNSQKERQAVLSLPKGDVYAMYRDTTSWYRLINPDLVDPAEKFKLPSAASAAINDAITQAEHFHTTVLGSYYHPNSYAFYGGDKAQLAFGTCRWNASDRAPAPLPDVLQNGAYLSRSADDGILVKFSDGTTTEFTHSGQDVPGDGTVPHQSGNGATAGVKQIFRTTGYSHQGCYSDETMLALTIQLVARIVQDAK